jgi:hypothetical protein
VLSPLSIPCGQLHGQFYGLAPPALIGWACVHRMSFAHVRKTTLFLWDDNNAHR